MVARAPKARHGRHERRVLWAIHHPGVLRWLGSTGTQRAPWPHARQLCRLERHRTPTRRGVPGGPTTVEVAYFVTSLPPERADAAALLRYQRGHWGIENRLHYVRDVAFDEDRSTVRSGAAPQTLAACRNLAIALLRRAGLPTSAAGLRTFADRPHAAIALIAASGAARGNAPAGRQSPAATDSTPARGNLADRTSLSGSCAR